MSDGHIIMKSGANSVSEGDVPQQIEIQKNKNIQDSSTSSPFSSQMPYLNTIQYRKPIATLPPNIAIPAGLAQVFVGGSMVVCGSFALRYRSYLFYYGSGLWAGSLAGICGALAVMATKKGPVKPRWLCGGRKWQIHIFLLSTMLALTANVLVSLFSTSGLLQDTHYSVGPEVEPLTKDGEIFEQRKSYGIAINAILLLLAMLEILLAFCSLGIALRVLCTSQHSSSSSPFSSDSAGSEVTMRDILGTGPEYEARKDRLLRWLGHQRRNFFLNSTRVQQQLKNNPYKDSNSGLIPHFVAVQPQQQINQQQSNLRFSPPGYPKHSLAPPRIIYHHSQPVIPYTPEAPNSHYGYPTFPVPICQLPVRRPRTPTNVCLNSENGKRKQIESLSGSSSSCKSKRSQQQQKRQQQQQQQQRHKTSRGGGGNKKNCKEKDNEITEEEIGKTYTGLDRVAAEDFISNTMNKY